MYGTVQEARGGRLIITAPEAVKIQPGDVVKITKPNMSRTIAQNAMLWAIIQQIADITGAGDPEHSMDIYCSILEEAGAKCEVLISPQGAEEILKSVFRVVRTIGIADAGDEDHPPLYQYRCYYGSSRMSTEEMGRLIDIAQQKLQEVQEWTRISKP